MCDSDVKFQLAELKRECLRSDTDTRWFVMLFGSLILSQVAKQDWVVAMAQTFALFCAAFVVVSVVVRPFLITFLEARDAKPEPEEKIETPQEATSRQYNRAIRGLRKK